MEPEAVAKAKDDLAVAIAALERAMQAEGCYMPALATLLMICADEAADRYPDDTNGGRTPPQEDGQ